MINPEQKQKILKILSPYKPKKLGVFGSYARGENTEKSDLDLLVEFGVSITLFDLIGLEHDLSDSLGVKVDLITERALSPYIRPYIEKDYQPIINEG
jgi:predicted nucleotidyltransferase